MNIQEKSLQRERDIHFMQAALKEAKKAFSEGEVPVGSVLVVEDTIVAKGRNQVELLQDATAHAEMLCLSSASSYFQDWRYEGATLYSTLEPCPMCAGALFSCRVKRVVWGAPDIRLGANGSFIDLFSMKHPMWKIEIEGFVLEAEASFLMKEFFYQRREKGRQEKKAVLSEPN